MEAPRPDSSLDEGGAGFPDPARRVGNSVCSPTRQATKLSGSRVNACGTACSCPRILGTGQVCNGSHLGVRDWLHRKARLSAATNTEFVWERAPLRPANKRDPPAAEAIQPERGRSPPKIPRSHSSPSPTDPPPQMKIPRTFPGCGPKTGKRGPILRTRHSHLLDSVFRSSIRKG